MTGIWTEGAIAGVSEGGGWAGTFFFSDLTCTGVIFLAGDGDWGFTGVYFKFIIVLDNDGNLTVALDPDRYYLLANTSTGAIFDGATAVANFPQVENGRYWQYQHHSYFIEEQAQGNSTVPVLMHASCQNFVTF